MHYPARVCACVHERKGSGGCRAGRKAGAINTACCGNHLLLQVECLLKWASQCGGSTQDIS